MTADVVAQPPRGQVPVTVSEAVGRANAAAQGLGQMLVMGEVSGFRGQNAKSGHVYCSLKDESSALSLTIWRGVYEASGVELRDGLQLQVLGSFDVYERSGKLSFVAKRIFLAGEGLLRQQVQQLARRLEAEGLMDVARKRQIPVFCERVCVVTSLSGSVIEDVKRTLRRRNPLVAIDCAGCSVQGREAPASIIRALQLAGSSKPQAILLVRGGGSYEDLMCFNDEQVARAIVACPVPVITGIGHEPDTTIADMVADRRCSTPTAAAESVAPSMSELAEKLDDRTRRLVAETNKHVSAARVSLDGLSARADMAVSNRLLSSRQRVESLAAHGVLRSPHAIVEGRRNQIEFSAQRLSDAIGARFEAFGRDASRLSESLAEKAARRVEAFGRDAARFVERLAGAGGRLTERDRAQVGRLEASLAALSPLAVLSRGYAIVRTSEGRVVTTSAALAEGERVAVTLGTGYFGATVTDVRQPDE